MLDRLKTLATQSASDTFSGDRSMLNDEFQSLLGEINRQAQSIGLNTGGEFDKTWPFTSEAAVATRAPWTLPTAR